MQNLSVIVTVLVAAAAIIAVLAPRFNKERSRRHQKMWGFDLQSGL